MNNWMDIARLDTRRSHLERICWPYDKYPDMPQLLAGTQVTLLDTDGPGVVTNMHVSSMYCLGGFTETTSANEPDANTRIIVEITYDHHETPDISMPLYAFLGDPQGRCGKYSTLYFGKVQDARNFRLPIPFDKHIKIVFKNPTRTDIVSYTDLQWKKLDALPEDCGYLRVEYKKDSARIPEDVPMLADIQGRGTVKAQWLCLNTDLDLAWDGEYICEGNQEFYIDGETSPSLEYLGTEDAYAHSWGLGASTCDGYSVIAGVQHPCENQTEITMLRCRMEDSIGFEKSLQLKLDYSQDYFSQYSTNPHVRKGVFTTRQQASFQLRYTSCLYYYGSRD